MICRAADCERTVYCRSLCKLHYSRMRRNGSLDAKVVRGPEHFEYRFWAKVDKGAAGGCWLWTASCQPSGYSQFTALDGRTVYGHRVAYELMVGPIPDGMTIDHLCFTRACVNPDHLEVVTRAENSRRQRRAQAETCGRGHPRTPENVAVTRSGERRCRVCHNDWQRGRQPKRKAS